MFTCEKDFVTKAGLRAVCIFVRGSHRCGYVAVPEGHPLFGKEYSDHLEVLRPLWQSVKNGPLGKRGVIPVVCAPQDDSPPSPDLVFNVHGSLTYSGGDGKYPVEGKNLWWFGFDCAHSGDRIGYDGELADGEERTLEYVEQECESLAQQLKDLQSGKR